MGARTVVLGKQVFDLTGRELDLGLLGLAEFLPSALLVFVTGTIADRHDRRRIAEIAISVEIVFVLALAWYASTDPTSALPIFLMVIGYGTARAFAFPATRALPADTVPATRLPWLVARQSMSWQAASIVGPVVGGFLYVVDVSLPFLVAAGLLVVAAVALLPALAEERLGVGAVGLGWLRAAVGIGAAAVTIVLAVKPVTRRVGSTMLIAVAVFGAGTIVLGVTTSFVVAFVALAVLSGADAVSVFIRGTLVPLVTPPDKRGRVLAVETVFIGASNELGAFESGVAGQLLGPAAAVVLGGAMTVLIAVSWTRLFPALRAVDRFPQGIS